MTTLYTLKNITQVYNGRLVLDIDQLTIKQGEVLALVGPSGAGKSTLLRLLAFLEQSHQGHMTYCQQECKAGWPNLAARRRISMVFQRPQLLHRSVQDNVAYGLHLRGRKKETDKILTVLQQLGLADLAQAQAHTLSGGEMQRVALARALVLQPQVLLLDEPTANLDPYNIKLIEDMIVQANQQMNTTIVIVTHNIFQAQRLADRVALLLNGRLIELADTETFFDAPKQAETAAFVRGDIVY